MALRLLDSFNTYSTAQIARRWPNIAAANGTVTIAAAGLYSPNCLRCSVTASAGRANVTRSFEAQVSWTLGFRLKFSAFPSTGTPVLASMYDAGFRQIELMLNPGGTLSITRNLNTLTGGTSTLALSAGAWNFIEWKGTISPSVSANQCAVWVNGVLWAAVAAGQNTRNTANSWATDIQLGPSTGISFSPFPGTIDYADLYLCDTASGITGPVGDRKVVVRAPNADGASSGWVGSDGDSAANYALANEGVSDDDASYVSSATVAADDLYNVADHGADIATVYAVQAVYTARKTTAGGRTLAPLARNAAGTVTAGTAFGLGDTYGQALQVWPTVPGSGGAWTLAELDALQVGQRVAT